MPFTHNPKPNFLTCPGVPELEPPKKETSSSVSGKEASHVASRESRVKNEGRGRFGMRPVVDSKKGTAAGPVANTANAPTPLEKSMALHSSKSAYGMNAAIARRPKRRHRWVLWSILAILAVVLTLTVPAAMSLARAASSAYTAKAAVGRMMVAFKNRDFDTAGTELETAKTSLGAAHDGLMGVGFWRNTPYVGSRLRALEDASEAGRETLDGVSPLIEVARDIVNIVSGSTFSDDTSVHVDPNRSFADLSADEKRAILARIARAIPEMHAAQAKIDIALDRWNQIPQNDLIAPLRASLAPVAENLPKLKQTLDEAVPLLEVSLPLAGYPSESDFLIFLQNTDEIRATGGFIGTVGTLNVDAGNVKTFSFDDIYNIDNPASSTWNEKGPSFMTARMNMPKLFLRDANYTPDYTVSAERLIDFYVREVEAGTGKRPQIPTGAIALNPAVFKELLRLVGPISIDGYTFTADTYFDILEYQVEVGFLEKGIPRNQRKMLVSKLGNELMAKLIALPASRWPEVLDVVTTALKEKEIQMYSRDPGFLARLDALGWTGRTKSTDGDSLWVVDTNLVSLKTDGVMEKNIAYHLDATDPSKLTATVTLRYTNHANEFHDYKYSRYRDYVRIYVPDGATFVSADGAMLDDPFKTGGVVKPGPVDTIHELGRTAFGAFWSIEPGETRTLTMVYTLPSSIGAKIAGGSYSLDWQKQAGNDNATLTLDAAFSKKLKDATPPEETSQWGDANYRVTATSQMDRHFEVKL